MGQAEMVTRAWKEWNLQALVLVSFTLQVALLVLSEFRRYMGSGVLRFFVWSAYMAADSIAIYVLGHLSVTIRRSPEQLELVSLWAPFLLLHLGGQDSITAYAIEDNKLWLRHLQTLLVQVAGAAYVIYLVGGTGSSRLPSLLLPGTTLMFIVDVVKYGERVWALKCAGSSPTGNYQSDIGKRRYSLSVADSITSRLDEAEAYLLHAHLLLDFAKDRFKGPLPRLFLYGPVSPGQELRGEEELYKVAEMQLSLLHDVFYTKAEVTHAWYGLCIRVLSTLATAVAFSLFNVVLWGHRRHRKLYSRVDVIVTYILFGGALVLEAMSLLRVVFSSWTCALLIRYGAEGSYKCYSLARIPMRLRWLVRAAEWRRSRSWSRSMGQLNLVQLCVRSRASRYSKMARWIGAEDWWNTVAYSGPAIPISASIRELLLRSLKARPWGREEFESRGLYGDPAWVADSKLEERILIWHIATEIYLRWYNDNKKNIEEGEEEEEEGNHNQDDSTAADAALPACGSNNDNKEEDHGDHNQDDSAAAAADTARALSNYMLYLLAARPHMLPPGAGRNDYVVLCYALTNHMRYDTAEEPLALLHQYAEALRSNPSAPEFQLTCRKTNKLGDRVLKGGCSLGAFLIHRQDNSSSSTPAAAGGDDGGGATLDMICQVWAQMLCGVADDCSANSHAKQLSCGGELLTVAAVIAKFMRSRMMSAHFHVESQRRSDW